MRQNNGVLIVLASNDLNIVNRVELYITTYEAFEKAELYASSILNSLRSVSASVYNLTLYNLEEKGKFSVIRNFYFNGAIHTNGKQYWENVLLDLAFMMQQSIRSSIDGDHYKNDRYPINSKSKWIVVGIDQSGYHSHQLRWCYESEGISKKLIRGKMNLKKFVDKIPTENYITEILHVYYPDRTSVNNSSRTIAKEKDEKPLTYLYKLVNYINEATENAIDPNEVQIEIDQQSIVEK